MWTFLYSRIYLTFKTIIVVFYHSAQQNVTVACRSLGFFSGQTHLPVTSRTCTTNRKCCEFWIVLPCAFAVRWPFRKLCVIITTWCPKCPRSCDAMFKVENLMRCIGSWYRVRDWEWRRHMGSSLIQVLPLQCWFLQSPPILVYED